MIFSHLQDAPWCSLFRATTLLSFPKFGTPFCEQNYFDSLSGVSLSTSAKINPGAMAPVELQPLHVACVRDAAELAAAAFVDSPIYVYIFEHMAASKRQADTHRHMYTQTHIVLPRAAALCKHLIPDIDA